MNSSLRVHTLRLHPGDDVMPELKKFIADNQIEAGFIMSAVGSLTQYNLRFANQPVGSQSVGHFEIVSLTGLLSTEGNHIHLSVSDSTGRTIGGHLLDGNLVYTTLELVIGEDLGHIYSREIDPTFGYKELVVKKKEN
ncbi:PPC domain-containing DNA-binding protein [Algoriphagus sp.]|uniref:PPC domain-containing DNA-binding protein n=1 Tax=Algoriphagus sp. TaxID=1872435 RepID=UPI003919C39C